MADIFEGIDKPALEWWRIKVMFSTIEECKKQIAFGHSVKYCRSVDNLARNEHRIQGICLAIGKDVLYLRDWIDKKEKAVKAYEKSKNE